MRRIRNVARGRRDHRCGAGYERRIIKSREAFVHQSGDTIVLRDAKKLTGTALLSSEEIAKRQVINAELRAKGKAARVKVVVKPLKLNKKAKKVAEEAAKKKKR